MRQQRTELILMHFPSDSVPERDHVELLFAKSKDRSDCLRKVLANL